METESETTVSLSKSGSGSDVNEARSGKFQLTVWEVMAVSGVVLTFVLGLLGLYFTMTASDYSFLKLPRTLQDIQNLSYSRICTVRAGITLGELQSVGDLYDIQSIAIMFVIGVIMITPTLLVNKSES